MVKKLKSSKLFILVVIIPTILAFIYNIFIATPVYTSETKVVVKSLSAVETSLGLGSFLNALGVLQPSTYGAYIVINHIISRDTMSELEKNFKIKEYYSSKDWDILRRFNPLGFDSSNENFYEYYQDRVVETSFDPNSGIVTVKVRAKDPEYSYKITEKILKLNEKFVNQINKRAYMTTLKYYRDQLEKSKKEIKKFSEKVKKFLTTTGTVSPEQQVGVTLQMIAKLQEELISKQMELSTIVSVAPNNPVIPQLKKEINQIKNKINELLISLTGGKGSLATHSVELELLKSELNMLYKELELNLAAFNSAQNQAQLQQLFIETVEKPVKPDAPMEPKVVKNIFIVFAIGFAMWGVLSLLLAGIKEHTGE